MMENLFVILDVVITLGILMLVISITALIVIWAVMTIIDIFK
jgi:hypothetical protein